MSRCARVVASLGSQLRAALVQARRWTPHRDGNDTTDMRSHSNAADRARCRSVRRAGRPNGAVRSHADRAALR
jgi:hypothetical protein